MGGFGGSGGGSISFADESPPPNRNLYAHLLSLPEQEPNNTQLWTSKTAILTAGDKVEFKFDLMANDVLMATAEGEAFDAALSVTDSTNQILAKNDDRFTGNQAPFVLHRARKDGTYSLNVISYRSTGGGRFTVKFRTLRSRDGAFGRQVFPAADKEPTHRNTFRLTLAKGQIVSLYSNSGSVAKVFGPTGVPDADFELIPSGTYGPILRAKSDGDYYFDYNSSRSDDFETRIEIVPVVPAGTVFEKELKFGPHQTQILEFPVTKGGLVWTTLSGTNLFSIVSAPEGEDKRTTGDGSTWFTNHSFTEWNARYGDDDDVVRIFKADGSARMVIRSLRSQGQTIRVQNRDTIPEWKDGIASQEKMGIGEVRLFKMTSAKSQLMRVAVQASGFVPRLDIFSTMGVLANSLSDRDNLRAADDLYFPNAGEWIIRVTCTGFGGSGPFTMRRDVPKTVPYALGSNLPFKLEGNNFGLFEVNLEKGKRYELLTNQGDRRFSVDVLNDEGEFLRPQTIRFDGLCAGYFVPEQSGRHRLWIRGEPGDFMTRLSLHKPPTVP